MKKNKLFLVLGLLLVSLSFGFTEAKAQTTVPVILHSWSGSMPNWEAQTTWWVTLHNNTTNEDYYFQTNSYSLYDDGYHLGYVTPGTYTVTVSYYNYSVWYDNFDWYINDQSSTQGVNMYAQTDYQLTNNVEVKDDYSSNPNNYGLNIYLYAM